MNKRNFLWWFWLILTVAVTAFILYNASRTGTDSIAASDSLIARLLLLLRRIETLIGPVDWHFWIRKAAHVTEYAMLGFAALSFAFRHSARYDRPFVAHAAFYALAVAVSDEFIQGFVERTSAVYDIVIDFGGVVLGFGMAALVAFLGRTRRQKGERV